MAAGVEAAYGFIAFMLSVLVAGSTIGFLLVLVARGMATAFGLLSEIIRRG